MISQPARHIRGVLTAVVLGALGAACSSQPPVSAETVSVAARAASVGDRAAAIALNQIGTPYRYGGSSPSGFDCSGLVQYSYARAGMPLPRTTKALWNTAAPVDSRRLQPGDLLFFEISGKMSHVGLYLGKGRFVHAPSSGKVVRVESLHSDYYSRAFLRAGRPQ